MILKPGVFSYPRSLYNECMEFGSLCYLSCAAKYRDRGQSSEKIVKQQIGHGKLCEWGVYHILNRAWLPVTKPDMSLIPANQKNFNCDLHLDVMRLHVKSQSISMVKKYGIGWMVEKNDPIVLRPTDNDIFMLCFLNLERHHVTLYKAIKSTDVTLLSPKNKKLKTKLVIGGFVPEKEERDEPYTIDFFDSRSTTERSVILSQNKITKDNIISIESYEDDMGKDVTRIWYFRGLRK